MKPKVIKAWGLAAEWGLFSCVVFDTREEARRVAKAMGLPANTVVQLTSRILPNRKAR